MTKLSWRTAMARALYGPEGFFARPCEGPAEHFRTSVHASPLFAAALLRLISRVDAALGHPDRLDVVDVGAGRGELLSTLHALLADPASTGTAASSLTPGQHGPAAAAGLRSSADAATGTASRRSGDLADRPVGRARAEAPRLRRSLAERIRFVGVEVAPRPTEVPVEIGWRRDVPEDIVGVLLATEWLDNVPLDVAEVDRDGRARRVLVDPATGRESLGADLDAADQVWVARWWPSPKPGDRVEVGWPRDVAWADAVSRVRRGCALAVDYGHLRSDRPRLGTLTGFRGGRQISPVPDGSCDVTAHVAVDAAAAAAGHPYRIVSQREALRGLGVNGGRPPLDLARTDPAGYLRALSSAGAAAELTDPVGLGGHWWLLHELGIDLRGTIQA